MLLKVGELAKRTGLTVRTLHHYDDIGLLVPSHRSDAGYRLYDNGDVARLHSIQALKQLGLSLSDIGETLAGNGMAFGDLIAQQLTALEQQAGRIARLQAQLRRLKAKVDQGVMPDTAEWIATLELMTMYEKYFTSDELQSLEKFRRSAESKQDLRWPELIDAMRALMENGIAPSDAQAQQRVAEWTALAENTVGNNPALLLKLQAMTLNEPAAQAHTGISPALLDYVMQCMRARQAAIYARYLTPEELARVMRGRAVTGPQWPPLVAAMRRLFEQDADVGDAAVRELAARWKALLDLSHGGDDVALKAKLQAAYAQEPELLRGTGLDLPLLAYVRRAIGALG